MFAAFDQRRALILAPSLALVLALPLPTGAFANAPALDRPADYAHILPLTIGANQAVVPLQLPRAVYLGARSPDLRDLRVFDAAGALMPFALTDLAPPAAVTRPSGAAAIFAVHGAGRAAQRTYDQLQIRTGSDGALISVTAPARAGADELASLVLDLGPAARTAQVAAAAPIGALALTLPPGTGSYEARVALDVSDDLQRWEEWTEATVSWLLNDQGASVQKHRIELTPRPARYARIRWIEGKPIVFAAIQAEYVVQRAAPRNVETLLVQAAPGGDGRDLLYNAPVAIPVRSLGLVFQGQNIVLPAQIGHYQAVSQQGPQLRPLVNTTFFQLDQNGQRRVSGDIDVPPTHAAQWVVRPLNTTSERPALRLRWESTGLVFVAAGKAPYRLAFGRTGVQPAGTALHQVAPGFSMRELASLEMATPGDVIQQQVAATVADKATDAASDRRVWLWALLVCGVAALAAMAWHLFNQLKSDAERPPPA